MYFSTNHYEHNMNQTSKTNTRTRKQPVAWTILITGCFMFALSLPSYSQKLGDLLVTPTRIVFEGSQRTQNLSLINIGKDTATYAISIIRYKMNEDGSLVQIEQPEPGQLLADSIIRYFPRSVTLKPQEPQSVRLQVRLPSDLPPGEYRSHIYFRGLNKQLVMGDEANKDTTSLTIKLSAIYGVAIPVIVRVGDLAVTAAISDVKVTAKKDTASSHIVSLTLARNGTKSVYGDFIVKLKKADGKEIDVGVSKGIALYTPNTKRSFQMSIRVPSELQSEKGTLHIMYQSRNELKEGILAETSIPFN